MATITFTVRGKVFNKQPSDFRAAVTNLQPGRIYKYSTVIGGRRYPIRQVLAAVTGLEAIAITSQDAYRILQKFGFSVDVSE